jgi:hypothetical protein
MYLDSKFNHLIAKEIGQKIEELVKCTKSHENFGR